MGYTNFLRYDILIEIKRMFKINSKKFKILVVLSIVVFVFLTIGFFILIFKNSILTLQYSN